MPLFTYGTILQSVQDACTQLNLSAPTGVYDSPDEHAVLMGSYANMIGPMLVDNYQWQQFDDTFEVIGDGVQVAYPLPDDYARFTEDTGWSHANRRPVVIVNSQQQAAIQAWISNSFFINPAVILENDGLNFLVAPALGERITFKYSSKNWAIDGTDPATKKYRMDNNADTPMFDSVLFTFALKLKWAEARGMPTAAYQADFNGRLDQTYGKNAMAQTLSLNGGVGSGWKYLDASNIPDTGIGI